MDQEQAIDAIDFNTIGLLVGMMLIVRLTESTGVYTWLAIRAGQWSRGRPFVLVLALGLTTAFLSAFLDNVTTVLLLVPITFVLADALDVDPIPLVIIEIVASNIGGTATLIGDPPNILIAGHTGLSFGAFIANLAPLVVVTIAVVIPGLYLVFRKRLAISPGARDRVRELDARKSIEEPEEAKRTVPILLATILLFFFHKALHLEPATVALAGASVMLLVTKQSLEEALSGIEWPTLFFLIGLFVMVGALEETGALGEVAEGIASVTGGDRTAELLGILWVSAIGSGIVDNIPFTAAMIPVVDDLGGARDDAYWWALALGACFGGNATVVAAAANVAASGMAARAGVPITFMTFLRYGIPVTLVSMILATGYVMVRYA
ncbi:MAG: Na+/H+ antiporter NhaD and related arsenite permeases [uncultured Solirubrobacteraceae bacterium]|uniref:Na+/H+ antiporter NhaD and related arsenite permeases n=1 Tax=uncultured Solirubrobacteraceae bacterium TaxID=1162706 RepID=A0A6J4SCC6_9ACTN|nr:MAG: Na+/H+ antiporter NhaD and related arsenite permeases [uncultured Solirubrobacteraceae bacterium]